MHTNTEILQGIHTIATLFQQTDKTIGNLHHLGKTEIEIIAFLSNNPEKDTARDITELRMLQKANVSASVETLSNLRYITTRQDEEDKRLYHLFLSDSAKAIAKEVPEARIQVWKKLLAGFSNEDTDLLFSLVRRIFANAQDTL